MTANILVIEDNPDNIRLVTWILEDEGYEVACAETAEAGLAMMEENAYSIVLMDISLPGMNGKEATKVIRSKPHLAHTPIIALTAHAIKGEQLSIREAGVDELLTKPLDDDKLLEVIQKYLKA